MEQAQVGFRPETLKKAQDLFKRYPQKVHALLPLLHLAQKENEGWLPPGWDSYIAELCETSLTHVRGVVTFYNMFREKKPGKYHLMVCTCLPCGLCGGKELLELLEHQVGILPGQTSEDGKFSLEEVQCLAACDKAPLLKVNEDIHGPLTLEAAEKLVKRLELNDED